jgi:predicted transcriptional regulator
MKPTHPKGVQIAVRLDHDLAERIQRLADQEPEYEGVMARVMRKGARELVDRELAGTDTEAEVAA